MRDLGRFVDLVRVLALRSVKVRYKHAALGVLWSLGVPLLLAAVFSLLFTRILRADVPDYPVFVLSALFPWLFFQAALSAAVEAYIGGADLLKRIAFPRPALPVGAVAAEAVHLVVSLIILCAVAAAAGRLQVGAVLWTPVPLVGLLVLAGAAAVFAAVLQAYFRDVKYVVQLGLLLLFYLVPVIYAPEMLSGPLRRLVVWNPFSAIVLPFRAIFYEGTRPAAGDLVRLYLFAAAAAAGAAATHRRLAGRLADVV